MIDNNSYYSGSDYSNIHYPLEDNNYKVGSETIGLPFIHISWMMPNMNERRFKK